MNKLTFPKATTRKPNTKLDNTLMPYEGQWEIIQAAHLFRRCTFGATLEQIKAAVDLGLELTLDLLFEEQPLPAPPIYYDTNEDPQIGLGETWVDTPNYADVDIRGNRRRSLRAWTIGVLLGEGISIREKLTLFWHNHFALRDTGDPRFTYKHNTLLRSFAWGNFKDLIKEVTIDPLMLRVLNGNQNTNVAPNENFARELLQLYTIGKGPLAGPGDYTNYTEHDIHELAKVLTGWSDTGHNGTDPGVLVGALFSYDNHDTSVKVLSDRFDGFVISDMGDLEYLILIDAIFEKEEVARFISRKLYRWFVYYTIDELVEVNVIEPMAQLLIENNYEIKPALQALLGSAHFFDMQNRGPLIKNPIDFSLSVLKQFEVDFPEITSVEDVEVQYKVWFQHFTQIKGMDMEYYRPPSVAGWKAYYQEPLFYRSWINASTLPARMIFTDKMSHNGYNSSGFVTNVDVLKFIEKLDNPYDPNAVIDEPASLIFPMPITEEQKLELKEVLIPGLPDFEWSVEYAEYAADPSNSELAEAIEAKLRNLLKVLFSMPEFYLS